jgi:hypothetical protein
MDNFGSKFTALTSIAGSKNEYDSRGEKFLTKTQWVIVVASGIAIALGIHFWLRASGL